MMKLVLKIFLSLLVSITHGSAVESKQTLAKQGLRGLQSNGFVACGSTAFCAIANQDCVDDSTCVCKFGFTVNPETKICEPKDECRAPSYPCPVDDSLDMVSSFCVDRDPDQFGYKCGCLNGFIPVLPPAESTVMVNGEMTPVNADGVPVAFRPIACMVNETYFEEIAQQMTTATPTTTTPVPANTIRCDRKCDKVKETCIAAGNPNEDGEYPCTCNPGYEKSPGGGCQTIAHCSRPDLNNCDENADCIEQDGYPGFDCICKPGFDGFGRQCTETPPPTPVPTSRAPTVPAVATVPPPLIEDNNNAPAPTPCAVATNVGCSSAQRCQLDGTCANAVFGVALASQVFTDGSVEISAFHPPSAMLYSTKGGSVLNVLDMSSPASPVSRPDIDLGVQTSGNSEGNEESATSVAIYENLMVVAIKEGGVKGRVQIYSLAGDTPVLVSTQPVGAGPDMVTFSEDGKKLLVANEGEVDGSNNAEGTVSILSLNKDGTIVSNVLVSFPVNMIAAAGVRVIDSSLDARLEIEPEYISVSGNKAYVTLQENNAVAVVDIDAKIVTDIFSLGFKDHSISGLDPSDRDNIDGNIQTFNNLKGMYMPDAIASYVVGGTTYFVTANEGDARTEDERIEDLTLDPVAFPNATFLMAEDVLGRLQVSTVDGDTDGDGDYDMLVAYGARSFSIWNGETGSLVYDSGEELSRIVLERFGELWDDGRSDNKGCEPEGVVLGSIAGRTFAFVGLERYHAIVIYDISVPSKPFFQDIVHTANDERPEGLLFVDADDSPTNEYLLIATHEESNSITTYKFNPFPTSSFKLEVTEIWPGQAGTDLTADWFEISNTGTDCWVSGSSPDLYYDDDSFNATLAAIIEGLTTICPGEAAVVLAGVSTEGSKATVSEFLAVWGAVFDLSSVGVGYADGSGLGGTSDAVTLFAASNDGLMELSRLEYENAGDSNGQSFDSNSMSYSVADQNGALATLAKGGNSLDVPAVGSPGNAPAAGSIMLAITEMYFGPSGVTADWFEISNNGTACWVGGASPTLYYDDFRARAETADPISGLTSICPGEVVVVVVGDQDDVTTFRDVWNEVIDTNLFEVGMVDGAGMSADEIDGATLWLDDPMSAEGILLDKQSYTDPTGFEQKSWNVMSQSFSAIGFLGALATMGGNPAIASPGDVSTSGPASDEPNTDPSLPATVVLVVSEIWPGQDGTDITEDWFEITNIGTQGYDRSTMPLLFYDDESQSTQDADPIQNIDAIAAGESVVVVIGSSADVGTFTGAWDATYLGATQIGFADGAGLSGGGDGVTLLIGTEEGGATSVIEFKAYPSPEADAANDAKSYDLGLMAFSEVSNANGAIASTTGGGSNNDKKAIGSPGRGSTAPSSQF